MSIYKAKISKQFENPIGQEFYTFYLQESNRGTRFHVDTGIFKVRILKERPNSVFMEYEYEVIEVLGKPTPSVKEKLSYYINSFHAQSANTLFTSLEEAIEKYDAEIRKMIKNPKCNSDEVNLLYKKLINQPDEKEKALMWYKSLTKTQKDFIKILNK